MGSQTTRNLPALPVLFLSIISLVCAVRAGEPDPWDQSKVPLEVDTKDPSLTKIVLIAGPRSHGPGEHEFFAGCALLMDLLKQTPGVFPVMCRDGWPKNQAIFDGAKSIVCFSDGGGGHPLVRDNHLQIIGEYMKNGVGLACLHYAVEPTKEKGQREFLAWIGGAFEVNWSVNPHWDADFKDFPKHPAANGVVPFHLNDEWYFHMRFVDGMKGVTPLLASIAPASTMERGDGTHSGNPDVRKAVAAGTPQEMAWAYDRPDGVGRGFGFTGGHFHKNWGEPSFRKLVVNAILWTAHLDIPAAGAKCDLKPADLNKNLDDKGQRKTP
jgi:type 1 glutamine amidotransferase